MVDRKLGRATTSIQITWAQKDRMSRYKKEIQRYAKQKNPNYESDSQVFERILAEHEKRHPLPKDAQPKQTLQYLKEE